MPEAYSELEKRILGVLESGPKTQNQLSKKLKTPMSTIQGRLDRLVFNRKISSYKGYIISSLGGAPLIYFGKTEHILELQQNDPLANEILEALDEPRTVSYLVSSLRNLPAFSW